MLIQTILSCTDLLRASPPQIFPDLSSCCDPLQHGLGWPDHTIRQTGDRGEIHIDKLDILPHYKVSRMIVDLCGRPGQWQFPKRLFQALDYHRFRHNRWQDKIYSAIGNPVCWHGYRLFLSHLFDADPTARVEMCLMVHSKGRYLRRLQRIIIGPKFEPMRRTYPVWPDSFDCLYDADVEAGYTCHCENRGLT